MFICKENEYRDDFYVLDEDFYETDTRDWFTGNCETCYKKILKKYYSVRFPLTKGGWRGCYCSWGCVKVDIYRDDTEVPEIVLNYINILEENFLKIGIYERENETMFPFGTSSQYIIEKRENLDITFEEAKEIMKIPRKREFLVNNLPGNRYIPEDFESYNLKDNKLKDKIDVLLE